MKTTFALLWALAMPLCSGCVSLEFPGIVSDTARVGKEAYRKVTGQKDEAAAADRAGAGGQYFSHAYVGRATQTVAEVRQSCIDEAVDKLQKSLRKDVPYTVVDVSITTVDNLPVANCKLALGSTPAADDGKK